ncbi:hypothetical protein [Streptosporangium sp. NPDC049376]|uniref:hypothetical protein n=1 Tax=Streptosporangium sp. NPDC049376 TaxID=3366192 RepID=UPI0037AD567D
MTAYYFRPNPNRTETVTVVADRIEDSGGFRHFVRRGVIIRSVPAGTIIGHGVSSEDLRPRSRPI